MKNLISSCGLPLLVALMLVQPAGAAPAAEAVVLPCASFAPGNSWRYSETGTLGSSVSSSTVSYVQGNDISINERRTISQRIHPDGSGTWPDADQLVRRKLRRIDDTVYVAGYTIELKTSGTFESRTSIGPGAGAPECGTLPGTAQYDQTTFVNGRTTRQRVKVVTTLVGPARITVPAGEFDTTVVRRLYTVTQVAGAMGPQSPTIRIEMLIHAVAKVGVVRTETKNESSATRSSSTTDLVSYRLK